MSQNKLKNLLNYSTSLSSTADGEAATTSPTPAKKLDPSILQALMGPDDAQLMLSSMEAIEDDSLPEEQHEIAFENLEALVEQIDNAKNLQNMKLWTPLLKQLSKSEELFRRGGCAVIATAVQNNPVSQADFLQYDGLGPVLSLFENDPLHSVRKKALFAITCTIRNNPAGLQKFGELGGWKVFSDYMDEVRDIQMQKRIIFFLGTIYQEDHATLSLDEAIKTGFPPKLVRLLDHRKVQEDEDLTEKILQTLFAAVKSNPDVLNKELKQKLKVLAERMSTQYGPDMCQFDELFKLLE